MTTYYYQNNEILLPKWQTPEKGSKVPWLLLLGLLALVLLASGAWLYWWFLPERNAKIATVLVVADSDGDGEMDSQGSGVIINPNGLILTNKHVVSHDGQPPAGKMEVWYRPGSDSRQIMEASLEKQGEGVPGTSIEDIKNDWAILRVTGNQTLPYVKLDEKTDFQEEEEVKAYGFPRGWDTATNPYGPSVKVLHGIINRVDRSAQSGVVRLTHSAKTAEGMSGGPVTTRGKLIGLNTAVLTGGAVDPNENYALPIYLIQEHLKDFLPSH